MIQPKQDYMIVIKEEDKKPRIIMPENAKIATNMVPFKVISIGPGRYENGVFIKTTIGPGDLVFINGGIIETKWQDKPFFFAREKDVVAQLTKGNMND